VAALPTAHDPAIASARVDNEEMPAATPAALDTSRLVSGFVGFIGHAIAHATPPASASTIQDETRAANRGLSDSP
jgi:hypothetical protein